MTRILAILIAAAFASFSAGAFAATDKAAVKAANDEYKAAKKACDKMKGAEEKACNKEAKAKRDAARAAAKTDKK